MPRKISLSSREGLSKSLPESSAQLCAGTFRTFVYATSTALISLSFLLASQGW